jgi:hypothetical protein
MSKGKIESLQDMYRYTVDHSTKALEKFPADKRYFQIKPKKGHALWQVGHMALSLDLFVNNWALNAAPALPGDWMPKFAPDVVGGQDPQPDPKGYPSWDEVLENYKKAGARTIELLGKLDDSVLGGDLLGPCPPPAKAFFGKLGQTLLGMAMHDSHHEGQLALLKGAAS